MTNFTRQLRDILSEDDFDAVFAILKTFLTSVSPNNALFNDLAMIKGNHAAATKNFYNNEISRDNYTLETAKVRRAVTMILEEIDHSLFDEAKANAITEQVLKEKQTTLSLKSAKNWQQYALFVPLVLIPLGVVYYLVFSDTNSKSIQKISALQSNETPKKQIKSTDFDIYSKEAGRIRQTVGQDNYTTEDGRARIRRVKKLLDTALIARPDDAMTFNERADCYMILGKLDSAMADIETSLSYDSYNTYTYATRAQIKALKGDVEGFYKDIEEALRRGHKVWEMRNSLGVRDHRYEPRFIRLLKNFKQYEQ